MTRTRTQSRTQSRTQPKTKEGLTKRTVLPGSAQAETAGVPARKQDLSTIQLAQIVNLHIGGYSLQQIADSIGATADEIDRILTNDVSRYVRSQPALRVYVRNWISEKYMKMIEADYEMATDKTHPHKLDNQDRVMRMLDRMAKLHGADAPVQSEVKLDAAPEAVERLVTALSQQNGLAYDADIFDQDVVDAEVIENAVHESEIALLDAGEQVGEDTEVDEQVDGQIDDGEF